MGRTTIRPGPGTPFFNVLRAGIDKPRGYRRNRFADAVRGPTGPRGGRARQRPSHQRITESRMLTRIMVVMGK